MSVEIDNNDTENTSAKLALRFLQLSGSINKGRPSAGLQMQHSFQDSFVPINEDLKIFKLELCPEMEKIDFVPKKGVLYQVINDLPIRIVKLKLEGSEVSKVDMDKEDMKIFTR